MIFSETRLFAYSHVALIIATLPDERRGPMDPRDPRGGPPDPRGGPPDQGRFGPSRDPRGDRGGPGQEPRFQGPGQSPQQQWGPPQGGHSMGGPGGQGPGGESSFGFLPPTNKKANNGFET